LIPTFARQSAEPDANVGIGPLAVVPRKIWLIREKAEHTPPPIIVFCAIRKFARTENRKSGGGSAQVETPPFGFFWEAAMTNSSHSNPGETHSFTAEEARQGEIVLRKRWQKFVFFGGLAVSVLLVLVFKFAAGA
jgi:hypothetical protein